MELTSIFLAPSLVNLWSVKVKEYKQTFTKVDSCNSLFLIKILPNDISESVNHLKFNKSPDYGNTSGFSLIYKGD